MAVRESERSAAVAGRDDCVILDLADVPARAREVVRGILHHIAPPAYRRITGAWVAAFFQTH